jgi:hypothetical protein
MPFQILEVLGGGGRKLFPLYKMGGAPLPLHGRDYIRGGLTYGWHLTLVIFIVTVNYINVQKITHNKISWLIDILYRQQAFVGRDATA